MKTKSKTREYIESLATALLVALLLRSFVVEAFKVPSASMVPSILIGDHLFVNKFVYGLRLPLTKQWFTRFQELKRGEIAVFIYPIDESKDFIKRVIGVGGDKIDFDGRQLSINDQKIPTYPASAQEQDGYLLLKSESGEAAEYKVNTFPDWQEYEYFVEWFDGEPHFVQYHRALPPFAYHTTVPAGHFFVMGDNRNRSSDSREWGFVPVDNLKGRAMFVWLSLDYDHWSVRFRRFGHWLE